MDANNKPTSEVKGNNYSAVLLRLNVSHCLVLSTICCTRLSDS
jgi:hypothetical protein